MRVAFPLFRLHAKLMQLVRNLFTVVMLFIILPWGAFAAPHIAPTRVINPGTLSFTDHASGCVAAIRDDIPTKVTTTKRCRIATLPGFSCSPDPVVQVTSVYPTYPPSQVAFLHSVGWGAAGWGDPPPRDPPRV